MWPRTFRVPLGRSTPGYGDPPAVAPAARHTSRDYISASGQPSSLGVDRSDEPPRRFCMRFSLITATLDRSEELSALLSSLSAQTNADFELIVVDQNDDDRLLPVLAGFPALKIQHLRCPVRALSLARNQGLQSATGQIVAFPDDDCLYKPETLAIVDSCFATDPALALLSGPAI